MIQKHSIPLHRPLLRDLARWLLSRVSGVVDLSRMQVLLPSSRAAGSLAHALLEESGHEALLLPRISTPDQLVKEASAYLDPDAQEAVPCELRAALLAPRLLVCDWVSDKQAAAGLAEELVELFDELRRHDRASLLSDPAPPKLLCGPEDLETLDRDLRCLREAWSLYREFVGRDAVDRLLDVVSNVEQEGWPGEECDLVVVAGFADPDPATARLLRAVLSRGEAHYFSFSADDALSRILLASYTDPHGAASPLQAAGRAAALLVGDSGDLGDPGDPPPAALAEQATSYYERLAVLGAEVADIETDETFRLLACSDPENESRVVAAIIAEFLQNWSGDRMPRVAVAVADTSLAARLVAQLTDAGLGEFLDDTGGRPLAATSAGLLVLHLLRAAVTRLRFEPLLELLTHPWVRIGHDEETHGRQLLRLEKTIRRAGRDSPRRLPIDGRHADVSSEMFRELQKLNLCEYVDGIIEALAPLLDDAAGEASWSSRLAALRQAWSRCAAAHRLAVGNEPGDLDSVAGLLDKLEMVVDELPDVSLSGFTSQIRRLLEDFEFRPRRAPFAPIQITGLLEARLEHFDLLILAGLSEDSFPGRITRPIFLSQVCRGALDLPDWRRQMALRAERFLHLIHNGDRVLVTWPAERQGEVCLPSPFVQRLSLGASKLVETAAPAPLYRRCEAPYAEIAAAQADFAAEPVEIPAGAGARRPRHLSHSSIASFRACPYRFLLEKGYDLDAPEEIRREFQAQDYGQLVHGILSAWHGAHKGAAGDLRAGRRDEALAKLREIAAEVFKSGSQELPQRRLWGQSFLRLTPAVLDFELARYQQWRPVAHEAEFKLPLGDLYRWLRNEGADVESLPDGAAELPLKGRIDRVDVRVGEAVAAVIDYKTGKVPAPKAVTDGEELQVVLYAVAVEAGAVTDLPAGPDGAPWRVDHGAYYGLSEKMVGFKNPQLKSGDRVVLVNGARIVYELARSIVVGPGSYPLVPQHWSGEAKGSAPCLHCDFLALCRLEERVGPGLNRLRRKLVSASGRGGGR